MADVVLRFILTAEELADEREFYGTAGRREVALSLNWPDCDYPALAGYTVHRKWREVPDGPDNLKVLGLRLCRLDPAYKPTKPFFDSGVEVSIQNAGGDKNGSVIGGCTVYLRPRKVEGKWVVDLDGMYD